jgi:putative ABC transport system substrate-binding protein
VRRRDFIALLSGGGVLAPLAVCAQEVGRTYRLGFSIPVGRESPAVVAFFDELRLFGFIESQNISVVPGGFDVRNDRLAEQAASVVKAAPDAIVSGPDNYTRVYQQATKTIPLIAMTEDMVAARLVASLNRPGGNTTGISRRSSTASGRTS